MLLVWTLQAQVQRGGIRPWAFLPPTLAASSPCHPQGLRRSDLCWGLRQFTAPPMAKPPLAPLGMGGAFPSTRGSFLPGTGRRTSFGALTKCCKHGGSRLLGFALRQFWRPES